MRTRPRPIFDTDWLKLETRIREQLKIANIAPDSKKILAGVVFAISEALGEETGSGFELDEDWWQMARSDGPNAACTECSQPLGGNHESRCGKRGVSVWTVFREDC